MRDARRERRVARPRHARSRRASPRSRQSLEEIAALPDPVGAVIAEWDRPNGLHIERVRTPLGVIGVIFESRPNVTADAGALCAEGRQRRDPARRLRHASELRRDPCLPRRGPARGRPARGRDPARADDRPRRRRRHAARPRRRHRRDRAARRQEPRGARAGGGARAGLRASRRRLPRLRPRAGRSRHGARRSSSTPRCGAPASAARRRRCSSTRPWRRATCAPLVEALQEAGCAIRGDAATRAAAAGVEPATRGRLVHRISRRDHRGARRRRPRRGDPPRLDLRLAPHRRDRHRRRGGGRSASWRRSIRRSCCTTPRPSSPTAASSAWARRSASPPAGCTRAARSASSS